MKILTDNYSVSFDSEALPWLPRPWTSSQKFSKMLIMIMRLMRFHFFSYAYGREGHVHDEIYMRLDSSIDFRWFSTENLLKIFIRK